MNKIWKPALLSLAVIIMAIGMINSGAWWTDTATTQTQSIKSGTLELRDAGFASFNLGTIDNMAPGDLTQEVVIEIKNTGTINMAWFGDLVVSDNILKNAIYIDHAKMEFFNADGTTWETVDEFILDGKGNGRWPTKWGGPEGYATLNFFDNNESHATGTKYEFMGSLKPGNYYKLTLRFGFYPGAGNEYQAAGPLDLSFAVDAYQVNQTALNAAGGGVGNHFTWMKNNLANQKPITLP